MTTAADVRVERDLVGPREVPVGVRYGVHSLRAAENFARPRAQLLRDVPELCAAFGMVKLAAVRANVRTGTVPAEVGSAIERAAEELIKGRSGIRDDLIVPMVQGGAGTSTNMNVNETLANRALELLGRTRGDYVHCHPNDHVNRSQSTNDVYPTAMRLAILLRSAGLELAAAQLEAELRRKARDYAGVRKLGRTQLQDAVAMEVGQEFEAWADLVSGASRALISARDGLLEVNLGGTAIGNGLTASRDYRALVVPYLAEISGHVFRSAHRRISATTDTSALLGYSGALRSLAVALAKIANDLRLLASGPSGGLAELRLPAVQGGSSMMPGKVNPVIAEWVNQLAFRIRGRDATVVAALDAGQLQLNAMLPLVATELLGGQADLKSAMHTLRRRCVSGIAVDRERAVALSRHDIGELSEVAANEGYALATALAKELRRTAAVAAEADDLSVMDTGEM
jgi:aspartate ammonia-lyase